MMEQPQTNTMNLLRAAFERAAFVAGDSLGLPLGIIDAAPPTSSALLRFELEFDGDAQLSWLVSREDATGFSDLLIGGTGDRTAVLTEMHLDALSAAISQMLDQAIEGINESLSLPLTGGGVDMGMEGAIPPLDAGGAQVSLALDIAGFGTVTVVQQANAALVSLVDSRVLGTPVAPVMVPSVMAPATEHAVSARVAEPSPAPPNAPAPGPETGIEFEEEQPAAFADPAVPLAEPGPFEPSLAASPAPERDNVVRLPNLTDREADQGRKGDIRMLLNVPLQVTVELGRTEQTIRELLELNVGSIIELSKLAGDPMDIMVNGQILARGEVVVIDEEFGIRVTDILSPEERLRKLG